MMDVALQIDLPEIMRTQACVSLFDVFHQHEHGAQNAFFVGGCVRDAVLGRQVKDIDIATSCLPDQVEGIFSRAGFNVIPTGKDHGTVTVLINKQSFEVTTLRRDIDTDGRHATVQFTDNWVEDANRRDFTINTLLADDKGRIYDPTGQGLSDLRAGQVLFVGDPLARIREDYLRILRFFRFYAYYGKDIDERALQACIAEAGSLKNLSRERITQEFFKILAADTADNVVQIMYQQGIVSDIIPIANPEGRLNGLIQLQKQYDAVSLMARLYVLFDRGGLRFKQSTKYLVYSNKEQKLYATLCNAMDFLYDEVNFPIKYMLYTYGRKVTLQAYFLFSATHSNQQAEGIVSRIREDNIPKFPLGGTQLKSLGMLQGPEMGSLLKQIESWWIEHDFKPDEQACLDYAQRLIG